MSFYILIIPHHGTHWYDDLREISSIYSIASNGKRRYSEIIPYFKEISKEFFATYINGDVVIPIYSTKLFKPILPYWCYKSI